MIALFLKRERGREREREFRLLKLKAERGGFFSFGHRILVA